MSEGWLMRWGEKLIAAGLILAVVSYSFWLGKSLWIQYEEQKKFEILRAEVRKNREKSPDQKLGYGQGAELKDEKNGEQQGEENLSQKETDILSEYKDLAERNPDFAGWISIEGTRVDYPVVESTKEREYYLHRDFYGNDSYSGTPFVGSGSLKEKSGAVFLYGHHMRNGTMFADLLNYREKSFWEQHSVISFDTLYEHRQYQIFTVFYARESDWIQEDGLLFAAVNSGRILGEKDRKVLADAGLYDTGIVPETGASLLFLVTCSYQEADGRFVVIGSRVL